MKGLLIFSVLIFCMSIFSENIDFAEFLFNEGDYYRCITELKRVYHSQEKDDSKIKNLIGVCYLLSNDTKNAYYYFNDIKNVSEYGYNNYLLTLFLDKRFDEIIESKGIENEKTAALKELSQMFMNKKLDTLSLDNDMKSIYSDYSKITRKNPFIGMLLSAVIPGLGRVYSQRNDDALFAFFTVLTPLIGTAYYYKIKNDWGVYITLSAASIFYIGELYGAFTSANKYFPAKQRMFYEKIINDYSNSVFMPDYIF